MKISSASGINAITVIGDAICMYLFGKTPVARWSMAQSLYKDAGCDARFVLYPGVEHTITKEIQNDILQFLRENSKPE